MSGIKSFLDMYQLNHLLSRWVSRCISAPIDVPPLTGTSTKCRQRLPGIKFKLWNSFAQPLLHEYWNTYTCHWFISFDKIQPWKEIGTQLLRYTVSLVVGLQLLTGVMANYLFIACLDSLPTFFFNYSNSVGAINYSFFLYIYTPKKIYFLTS